jgi:hypothetical protein
MYSLVQGLQHVKGIAIIQDTGIYSDHDMVVSKIDLGFKRMEICQDKEE